MNIKKWLRDNKTDLENKTICITGSTGGLAQTFIGLLSEIKLNFIFVNRDIAKSEEQKRQIQKINPDIKIEIIKADQFNIESVKESVKQLEKLKYDYLILNAAVYNVPIKMSSLGYNNIFQINFVSPYYLIKSLLPTIKNTTKIIVVGSIAHNFSKLNLDDIDFSKNGHQNKIYGNSKRFLMFSVFKLVKQNKGAKLCMIHPGVTYTNMTSHYPKAINWLVKLFVKLFFPSKKSACKSMLLSLKENTGYFEWIGPHIFNVWGNPKKKKLKTCTEEECEKVYEIANNIVDKIK